MRRCARCHKPMTTNGTWCSECHAIVKAEIHAEPPCGCNSDNDCTIDESRRGTRVRHTADECKAQKSTGKRPRYPSDVNALVRWTMNDLLN